MSSSSSTAADADSAAPSVFAICHAAAFGNNNTSNSNDSWSAVLECVSDAHQTQSTSGQATTTSVANGVNAFYLIFAGALVYFMQTGFAMLTAGSIRAKNVKNVLLWNLLDSCGGGLAFWMCGWAFAYGGDDSTSDTMTFIGTENFFLRSQNDVPYHLWFFQFTFACALSSIVAGTVAERCKMTAYLYYSFFLVGFVYPVVAHAVWSYHGFLSQTAVNPLWKTGAIDLAGSGPVHMTGGVAALAAALVLGPRVGRFTDRYGQRLDIPHEFPPHSVALQFLGTFCLWFGWYGFNPGSVLAIASTDLGRVAGLAAVNTTLSACTGALSALFISTIVDSARTGITSYDLSKTMNGCLTGLVGITAGCATVDTWAAVVIGIVSGALYLIGSELLVKCRIDDAVDAIPVHMVGGAWGVISTGLFTKGSLRDLAFPRTDLSGDDRAVGWFYEIYRGNGNDATLLGIQCVTVLFIFGWTFVVMGAYFLFLNAFGMLRIDPLEEEVGLDISRHKGAAYDIQSSDEHARAVEDLSQRRSRDGSSHHRGVVMPTTAAAAKSSSLPPNNNNNGVAVATPMPEAAAATDELQA